MSYKIQKWNVFPILLATTRVDWLGIEDREITQHFPILLEGILRDVFSQRASAAWQGAPPQKVAVSILLPTIYWLDDLQSQRHFWPSMTTRFVSMDSLKEMTLRKERQRLKSKHLWDTIDLDWDALYKKLYVHKPTGLSRDALEAAFLEQTQTQPLDGAGVPREGLLCYSPGLENSTTGDWPLSDYIYPVLYGSCGNDSSLY